MEIQKKSGNKISFDFQEESFLYQLKDRTGTKTLNINYLGVEINIIDEFIEREEWIRNTGIFWIVISLCYLIVFKTGGIWFVLGLIMLAVYNYRTTYFSILRSDEGSFFIIKDKKHDGILEKIRSEKRKLLREKYYCIDETNSPKNEAFKFQYLKDNGAITEEEFVKINTELLQKVGILEKSE